MGSKSIACKPALLNKPAELASTAATDVGMHGLLASQYRVTILCYPLVCVHCGPVVDFFITKQTSLHPFDFVRNLFHLLVKKEYEEHDLLGVLKKMKQRDIPKFNSIPSLLGKQMPTDLIMNMDDIVAADEP